MLKQGLIKLLGSEELVASFMKMNEEVQNKLVATAFRKSSAILLKEVRNNLVSYRRTGTLSNSFISEFRKSDKRIIVGASRRLGGYHAHLLEDGTQERYYFKRSGVKGESSTARYTGRMKATHFFSKAIDTSGDKVFETMANQFKKLIDKHFKKNNNN